MEGPNVELKLAQTLRAGAGRTRGVRRRAKTRKVKRIQGGAGGRTSPQLVALEVKVTALVSASGTTTSEEEGGEE